MVISNSFVKFFHYRHCFQSKIFHPDYTNRETLNTNNLLKYLPIAVSGIAKSVFSVATRKCPWTERPTPCAYSTSKGHSYKITGKNNHNHNAMQNTSCFAQQLNNI